MDKNTLSKWIVYWMYLCLKNSMLPLSMFIGSYCYFSCLLSLAVVNWKIGQRDKRMAQDCSLHFLYVAWFLRQMVFIFWYIFCLVLYFNSVLTEAYILFTFIIWHKTSAFFLFFIFFNRHFLSSLNISFMLEGMFFSFTFFTLFDKFHIKANI